MNILSNQVARMTPDYRCPICKKPLFLNNKNFHCLNKHSFDQAKQGYVNLLPVQFKHSKEPGDNKTMVRSRRAFLDQGYYQFLVDNMLSLYQKFGDISGKIFDAGCGEGFYTHQHKTNQNTVYGVDIAKEAIKIAAKRYQECNFSVATLSDLPFKDEQFSWIFSVYAPILETEFTRVLNKGGYLLTVTPGEQHLIELKKLIYRQATSHDTSKKIIQHMKLVEEIQVNYLMNLNKSEDRLNLLAMTPFAFRTSTNLIQHLRKIDDFTCQADFVLRLYKK